MTSTPARGPRHRPPPRPVEVVAVETLSPRMVSIRFGGESLTTFAEPAPTAHIKLFLPDADGNVAAPVSGPDGLEWPDGRPTMRTYTPRSFDAAAGTLDVWFVLHGEGPAARFAASAAVGDRAAIGGPGGRFAVDEGAERWWIGGDESALPAVAMLLEALPASVHADVHLEVADGRDEFTLPSHPGASVTWHHRSGAAPGALLRTELAEAAVDGETHVWVASEASAVRTIRADVLAAGTVPRAQLTTRGYWRIGEVNHPDHDYGED